jgi:2-polyprenyl-6-methoxyphenol hydroxylase-like FAD-dependent oxidoreductase
MSGWANVYRPLKDRFPAGRYHFGKTFKQFEPDPLVARFEDGSRIEADLLIGADGLRSTVRAQLFPGLEPAYAGYVAWRGVVPRAALSARAAGSLGIDYWLVLPPGEMMLCYLIPSKEGAGRLDWNYVWYRPASDALLRDIGTDARGARHGAGIPPPLIREEVREGIKRDAKALLAAPIAEIVERSQPFFQAIFDVESPRMAVGRSVLLGDAAFVARPHVGMGVTKAALDAACLARSLAAHAGDLDAALARYERLRGEFGRRCVARGRRVGSYIEAVTRPGRGWTPEQLDQRPERLLHEAAALLSDIPELACLPT